MWTASARHQYRRIGGRYATDVTDAECADRPLAAGRQARRATVDDGAARSAALLNLLRLGSVAHAGRPSRPRCSAREQAGREASLTAAIIDSQSVKTAEAGARAALTLARRSTAASAIASPRHWAYRCGWSFIPAQSCPYPCAFSKSRQSRMGLAICGRRVKGSLRGRRARPSQVGVHGRERCEVVVRGRAWWWCPPPFEGSHSVVASSRRGRTDGDGVAARFAQNCTLRPVLVQGHSVDGPARAPFRCSSGEPRQPGNRIWGAMPG